MSIQISKVRIKNFRSLKSVEVNLSPITLLVGANNAGKTSFLRALSIALNGDRKFISFDDLFIGSNGQSLPREEQIINIDILITPTSGNQFDEQWTLEFGPDIKQDSSTKDFFAFRTVIDFSNSIKEAQIKKYVITDWDSDSADETSNVTANLTAIPFYFIDAQRDLQEDIQARTSHFGKLASKIDYDETQRKKLETDLATLNEEAVANSPVLAHLKTSLEELNKTVQTQGKGVEITPFPKKVRDLHKGMKVHFQDGHSDTFSLEYHGMGTRSWASLLAFKAKISWDEKEKTEENEPFFPVLALEEPEAHLHPNAQRQVYRQLTEIKGQKIISTHSPYIAGQADLSELRHFYKEKDETEVSQLNINELNSDEQRKVSREVIYSNGELLFSKAIVLYEGETESQALPIFAYCYWNCYHFEKGISFISVSGNNYKPFLLLAKAMKIPWFIFSDYDKPNVKRGVDNALRLLGLDLSIEHNNVIKLGQPIEAYLISEGYHIELKSGINGWFATTTTENTDTRQIEAGQQKVNNFSDEQLLKDISSDDGKVRYPLYWAQEIINCEEENRRIPAKIKALFQEIDSILTKQTTVANETTTI